jgi:alpha-tubulin suppressor-like RCC1 family protein
VGDRRARRIAAKLAGGGAAILTLWALARCKRDAQRVTPPPVVSSTGADASPAPFRADVLLSANSRVQCVAKGSVLYRRGLETDAVPRRTAFDAPIVSVSCETVKACAVTTKHELWCFGANAMENELGVPTPDACDIGPCARQPTKVQGLPPMVEVVARAHTTCGVAEAGNVLCWGWRGASLGSGPTVIPGLPKANKVAVGSRFACALTREGEVWCWGLNSHGQLGIGAVSEPMEFLPPSRAVGLRQVTALGAGLSHACAMVRDGVACWGGSLDVQTGTATEPCAGMPCTPTPTLVDLPRGRTPVSLDLVGNSSCVLTQTGEVVCWGQNVDQTLGSASDSCSTPCVKRPRPLMGLPPMGAISLGGSHACALSNDGELLCWGGLSDAGLATSSLSTLDASATCAGCVGPLGRLNLATTFP